MAGNAFTIFKKHVFVVRHKRRKVFLWHFLPDGQIELSLHTCSMQQANNEATDYCWLKCRALVSSTCYRAPIFILRQI